MNDTLPDAGSNVERPRGRALTASSATASPHGSQDHPSCCSVAVDSDGACTTVSLSGELDVSAVGLVIEALTPHLDRPVTVDLGALTFLDSSGIQCLMILRREAQDRGGRLSLGSVSPPVRRVLEIAGLDEHSLRW